MSTPARRRIRELEQQLAEARAQYYGPADTQQRTAQLAARLLQDAWSEAWAATWMRRALLFEWAAPRETDYTGRATEAELDARAARTISAAVACRSRATGADGAATWHLAAATASLTITPDEQHRLDQAHQRLEDEQGRGTAA
ncbi:hypothetical protein QWJ41_14815 [Nocardioides sp. SOB44]|uniref:DUF222 domain-containing protein n=1 Tax=Nocardioides cremeus TaxID=3058044 RepID=A0ABT8TSQ9_9ACTN|nr:hypothetical protein [Nocardioides cremeus]MDO3396996.1 hypothetical protein [Nocardioides cremeus]